MTEEEQYDKDIKLGMKTMLWILRTLPKHEPQPPAPESPHPDGFTLLGKNKNEGV